MMNEQRRGVSWDSTRNVCICVIQCYWLLASAELELFFISLPPRPLKLPRLVDVGELPIMRFLIPSSTGNPMVSAVLVLAFFAYFLISAFESLIRNAASSSASAPRYSWGMCSKKASISEFVGQRFNKWSAYGTR